MDPGLGAATRERLQHAGACEILVGGARERHGQVVQIDRRGVGTPGVVGGVVGVLEQQVGLRHDDVEQLLRHGPFHDADECRYRQGGLHCCPRRDHQQVGPRRQRIVGVEGVGEIHQVPLDLLLDAVAERFAQPGGGRRDPFAIGAERLPDRGRACLPAAAGAAPELGNRAGQREFLRQQAGGALHAAVVAGGEAPHRLAEGPPRGERGPPRYASQETCRALPVAAVHRLEAAPYRPGVAPQRVDGREALQRVPATVDHQPVRHHPFRGRQRWPAGQVLAVCLHRFAAIEVAQIADQVRLRQISHRDRRPVLPGAVAHDGRLLGQALGGQLARACDAGAELPQGQVARGAVLPRYAAEQFQRLARVAVGQAPPRLRQQALGRQGPLRRALLLAVPGAPLIAHRCISRRQPVRRPMRTKCR